MEVKEQESNNEVYDMTALSSPDLPTLLQDGGRLIAAYSFNTWGPVFSQSRDYEKYAVDKVKAVIEDVLQREENLQNQKNALLEKLTLVSRSLGDPQRS